MKLYTLIYPYINHTLDGLDVEKTTLNLIFILNYFITLILHHFKMETTHMLDLDENWYGNKVNNSKYNGWGGFMGNDQVGPTVHGLHGAVACTGSFPSIYIHIVFIYFRIFYFKF